MAKASYCYDVESTKNYFAVVFVNTAAYLDIFKDIVDEKGNAIPLVDILTVAEIKERLDRVPCRIFELYENDDSDLLPLIGFLQTEMDIFGFNNYRYDRYMLSALLMYFNRFGTCRDLIKFLNETSSHIVRTGNQDMLYYDNFTKTLANNKVSFRDIDLMKVFRLDYIKKSLKQTSINIKWYNLLDWVMPPICELDAHYYKSIDAVKSFNLEQLNRYYTAVWDRFIPKEYLDSMRVYHKNDAFIVAEIIRLNKEEIIQRYQISAEYSIDVYSDSRSTIADKMIVKLYSKFTGLHPSVFTKTNTIRRKIVASEIVSPLIKFKTPELSSLLTEVKSRIFKGEKGEFIIPVSFKGTDYIMAAGGLHGDGVPSIFDSRVSDYLIKDCDVTSFYPNLIRYLKVVQKHLNPKAWFKIADIIVDGRVEAKHKSSDMSLSEISRIKYAVTAACLKIVANAGIFGKMGSERSFLCDKKAMYTVTINGQLLLFMLIEELELNGIHIISANTDGIVSTIPKDKVDDYYRICKEWEIYTKFELEYTDYELYVRENVNSYITRKLDGKYKLKGSRMNHNMFAEDLTKGYDAPIIAKAVNQYFLNNTPVMETLRSCTHILDFCKTQNIARKYELEYSRFENGKLIVEKVQRNNRFYVSTIGGSLMKVEVLGYNEDGTPKVKKASLCAGQRVTLCNLVSDTDISELSVDYKYYFNEAMAIINPIKLGLSKKDKRSIKKNFGMYNPLFDNDDFEDTADG